MKKSETLRQVLARSYDQVQRPRSDVTISETVMPRIWRRWRRRWMYLSWKIHDEAMTLRGMWSSENQTEPMKSCPFLFSVIPLTWFEPTSSFAWAREVVDFFCERLIISYHKMTFKAQKIEGRNCNGDRHYQQSQSGCPGVGEPSPWSCLPDKSGWTVLHLQGTG